MLTVSLSKLWSLCSCSTMVYAGIYHIFLASVVIYLGYVKVFDHKNKCPDILSDVSGSHELVLKVECSWFEKVDSRYYLATTASLNQRQYDSLTSVFVPYIELIAYRCKYVLFLYWYFV